MLLSALEHKTSGYVTQLCAFTCTWCACVSDSNRIICWLLLAEGLTDIKHCAQRACNCISAQNCVWFMKRLNWINSQDWQHSSHSKTEFEAQSQWLFKAAAFFLWRLMHLSVTHFHQNRMFWFYRHSQLKMKIPFPKQQMGLCLFDTRRTNWMTFDFTMSSKRQIR